MDDVYEVHLNLPYSVKGVVLPNSDGSYTRIINIKHLDNAKEIREHEDAHIMCNDLDADKPISLAEGI